MDNYRLLTDDEITVLEDNGCTAEDWTKVSVAEEFRPIHIHDARFHGEVRLGVFEKSLEISRGFLRHSGIRNATLRNVSIGDNCLIENIGNHINNYVIGEDCIVNNVCTMETTDGATFGEGTVISVLNEAGSGNVMLFSGLTANLAALMVRHSHDKDFTAALRDMVRAEITENMPDIGTIGDRVKITNTSEITNTHIADDCEVNGACRLSDCTIAASFENNVYIGSGVICENSIIADGSAVLNSAKINNCYIGECSQLTNGFTAESSLFFANCYMSNGEACAAFCGPFSTSHHKSSLLIGCMVSFYNAGAATNFSNHAYKMGPVHYGILERGSKTASGSHLLFPARIGAFSVCIGKITSHPDTACMPFSYIIADGRNTSLVPAINLATAGLFRDVRKWQRRDVRPFNGRKSAANYDWLNPMTMNEVERGLSALRQVLRLSGGEMPFYTYNNCKISRNSLSRGIKYYTMAADMFLAHALKEKSVDDIRNSNGTADADGGADEWADLAGLLLPLSEESRIVDEVKSGVLCGVSALTGRLNACHGRYKEWVSDYALRFACKHLGIEEITEETLRQIEEQGTAAREKWLDAIKEDAEREYALGDVDMDTLEKFIAQLDAERE